MHFGFLRIVMGVKHMEFTKITSRANAIIVETAKLSDKKYREQTGLFCLEGWKLLSEAIDAGAEITRVFVAEAAAQKYEALLTQLSCPLYLVSDAVFDRLTTEKAPQGIFACVKKLDNSILHHKIYMKRSQFSSIIIREKIFVCDGLRDPGNLGTIIRTANALGFDRLVLSSDCVDVYNPKVVRGAMGALFRLHIDISDDMCAYVASLKENGYTVYAATLQEGAQTLGSFTVDESTVFVVGNEGHGLSEQTIAACNGSVIIPMAENAESFNAAIASALLMWERSKVHGN